MRKYLGLKALAGYLCLGTQKEFANATGIDKAIVNRHWNSSDNSRPSLRALEKVATTQNMTVENVVHYLYGEETS